MSQAAIDVRHVSVSYATEVALWNVSLQIPQGSVCAIVGPNGAGKTTLLKALLNLITPISGTMEFFGSPYAAYQDRIAYVPQRRTVDWDFPVSVLDVVLMGAYRRLGWFRRPGPKDIEQAHHVLKKVQLDAYADRHISQLSGGQQQRVFLARALMQDALLYLMDEPFVGVDKKSEKTIVHLLQELQAQGKTIVVVHHDLQTLREYFNWMILLNVNVVAAGPVQDVFTHENLEVAYEGPVLFSAPTIET
jgi:manganese/zinc/iron transport system ATP- binding protein